MADELTLALDLLRDRIDRDLLGLLDNGDFAANLLRYLRHRERPRLLFDFDKLASIAALAEQHDPAEFAWEKRIADEAVGGRLYGASNAYCERFLELDRKTFDFSSHPNPDPQTIHGLNRHRWLASLGRTFWRDQRDVYFEAMMREWDFFIEKVPFPDESFLHGIHAFGPSNLKPPFSELDLFIRLTNWYWAYWLAVPAHPMTPERNAILLARCLQQFDLVAARGIRQHEHNFTSMQMEALYLWAAALPEFTGMTVWKHAARNILESSQMRATWEDGVQWEKSAGYHVGCIRWYGTSYFLGQRNGETWSENYGRRLGEMGDVVDAIVTPDGNIPLISDSDRTGGWQGALSLLRAIFPAKPFQNAVTPTYASLWASNGTVWETATSPTRRLAVFPQGGIGVIRSSGANTANQVLVDNGPTHAGHAHKHNLTFHWEAGGRPTIVDPGRWIYAQDVDRNWVTRPESHNTLVIEDTPVEAGRMIESLGFQIIPVPGDPRLTSVEATDAGDWLSLATGFRAYTADRSACVHRRLFGGTDERCPWLVVIDDLAADQPHVWTNSFLFPADTPVEQDGSGWRVALDQRHLAFVAHTEADLTTRDDPMFWCPNYGEKSPARWFRLSARSACARRVFAFVAGESAPDLPHLDVTHDHTSVTIASRRYRLV